LILRDIFPQNAVDLGMMKKDGMLYNFFRKKEHLMYEVADEIGCMSQGNIDYVINHNPKVSTENYISYRIGKRNSSVFWRQKRFKDEV